MVRVACRTSVGVRRRSGQAALGHQQVRRDVPDADHPETLLLEDAANARQQMIVAAPERGQHPPEHAQRAPVETDFRQRRPRQRADKDQIAAILAAKQFCRPADLADRDPVVAKTFDPHGIAGPAQGEQYWRNAAGDQRIRDRERHRTASRDQANRR